LLSEVLIIFEVLGMSSVVELLERLAKRDELIESLSAELGKARVRIAELEARLEQTSKNSLKPPSSDGLAKPVGFAQLAKCVAGLSGVPQMVSTLWDGKAPRSCDGPQEKTRRKLREPAVDRERD
jgi:hypothetical protein